MLLSLINLLKLTYVLFYLNIKLCAQQNSFKKSQLKKLLIELPINFNYKTLDLTFIPLNQTANILILMLLELNKINLDY